MGKRLLALAVLASVLVAVPAVPGSASFHLWDVQEVYSDAAGEMQYVELFTSANGQEFVDGFALTATSDGVDVVFEFPTDSPAPTGGRTLLLATPAYTTFASDMGLPAPDFQLPAGFFDPDGDSIEINFAGVDSVTFTGASLPTDGVSSLNYPGSAVSVATPANFSGTTASIPDLPDVALFNPNNGQWNLRYRDGHRAEFFYGVPGDTPLMGDWDCDGTDTVAMYRESTGFIYYRNTNDFGVADGDFFFGIPGDIPIAGDWNNNGCDTFGIYRNGKVFLRNSLSTGVADKEFFFGVQGDRPFAGDFTGDGTDTVGLYRQSSGLAYFTDTIPAGDVATTDNEFFYGVPSDRILADDWDGDGDDSVGIFRPGDQKFYLSFENLLQDADLVIALGQTGWLPAGGEMVPQNPGDSVDCTDFSTQAAAQAWFDYYVHWYGDVAVLDVDANGVACESLP
ncbi:MAG: hypothetical protein HKN74_04125 [Acidimicrobiia bacterium]|nr:hypothetical protein [Acidimicrobiia bacterium]NNF09452.1 hypothetical protein [Acidimicrobiia bacterium]NNL71680.1 hypothetical protein [Acidimicrobiia bacterium]